MSHAKALQVLVVAFCLLLLATGSAQADRPQLNSVKMQHGSPVIKLKGGPFGNKCEQCAVVADYGKFRYRLAVRKWGNKSITARLPDLGARLKVSVVVKSSGGSSKPRSVRIKPDIVPKKIIEKLVKPESVPGLVLHEFRSQDSLGEKGDKHYQVAEPVPQCGKKGFLFENARLVLGKRTRFGQARIISAPEKGCSKCIPLAVRYFYEPTGALHYQLHIYRRKIEGICPAQMLR